LKPPFPSTTVPRVLLIGAGGIGCPFALAASHAVSRGEWPPVELHVVDDDVVELENLHRQILFRDEDVGLQKGALLAEFFRRISGCSAQHVETRFHPDNALALASSVDVVVDASDNFATRFLAADACLLAGRPLVSAASVRWVATVLLSRPEGPCYRCLFEDLPEGDAPDCTTAGIVGPVCGVAGALAAELVGAILRGRAAEVLALRSYDGRTDQLRERPLRRRSACPLCGTRAIRDLSPTRYVGADCELGS
jgi:molybdopterin/thiamine biosynthesis adenylyltransferase